MISATIVERLDIAVRGSKGQIPIRNA